MLEPQYIQATSFSAGLACVRMKERDPWTFVDKTGKVVLQTKLSSPSFFSDGLAQLETGTPYMDKTGATVISAGMSWGIFSEGLAAVAKKEASGKYTWGYINTQEL